MGTRETYRNVLVRACIIAGDETLLAKQLEIPVTAVVECLLGDAPVPTEVFLRAVDVVMAANRKQIQNNRVGLQEMKRQQRLLEQVRARHRRC